MTTKEKIYVAITSILFMIGWTLLSGLFLAFGIMGGNILFGLIMFIMFESAAVLFMFVNIYSDCFHREND